MDPNNPYSSYNQPTPSAGATSSYASRSAQAYEQQQQQQQQYQQQYQQQQLQSPSQPLMNQSFQQPTQYYSPSPSVAQPAVNFTPSSYPQHQPQMMQSPPPLPPTPAVSIPTQIPPYQQSTTPNIQTHNEQNLLDASIRRMQEAIHIMRGAMDANDLSTTLDRAAAMLGELGDQRHHHHHHHHHHSSHHHSSSSSTAIMSPKHYYEIHMIAMEELPNIEEYLLSLSLAPSSRYTMKDLYEMTQYTPRAVPRLYLQICAGSALIRSGEVDVTVVLDDLIQVVKCVQCPIRGLFLRDYLLKAVRDKLPDEVEQKDDHAVMIHNQTSDDDNNNIVVSESNPSMEEKTGDDIDGFDDVDIGTENEQEEQPETAHNAALASLMDNLTINMNESDGFLQTDDNSINIQAPINQESEVHLANTNVNTFNITPITPGRVKDSYQFVLANFIEMNKLWVRIQHLPGDAKNKETKRRRERERNELRMMVGTNLVRLSELEGVTSAIYGTVILPRILDQIVACRDPLAQAYLMDCIIQVFPDEFHIQTLEVVLNVCSKLRDKVNIRTILQSIMDRLANYYADELLLNDEEDTEGVKTSVMLDSFEMFDTCIRSVIEARGVKINAKEVIRLESSLLDFSLKCYPGRMDHINRCLGVCASCLRGEGTSTGSAVAESGGYNPIPIDEVAVQELEKLLSLPLETMGLNILDLDQYSELLSFLPFEHRKRVGMELLNVLYQSGERMTEVREIEQLFAIIRPFIHIDIHNETSASTIVEREAISKLIHLLYNEDTDVHFEILNLVKKYLFSSDAGIQISSYTVSPIFFSSMKLLERVECLEFPNVAEDISGKIDKEEMCEKGDTVEEQEQTCYDGNSDDDQEGDKNNEVEIVSTQENENVTNEGDAIIENSLPSKELSLDKEDIDAIESSQTTIDDNALVNEGDANPFNHQLADEIDRDEDAEASGEDISSGPKQHELSIATDIDDHVHENDTKLSKVKMPSGGDQKVEDNDLFSNQERTQTDRIFSKVTNCRKIFLFVQKLLSFVEMNNPGLCFGLRLHAVVAADRCAIAASKQDDKSNDFASIAYEFMSEAFSTYEAEITESTTQRSAVTSIVGVLLLCRCFDKKDYEALITKTTQYAARLSKKTDQCSMVLTCSHLFFKEESVYQNSQRVLECLQRALKLADICTTASSANLQLFVDIFDTYVYYFEKGNPYVTDKFVSGLIALIREHINTIGLTNPVIKNTNDHFCRILDYIERKKSDPSNDEKFAPIISSI